MAIRTTEAVVLKTHAFRSTSLIATLYTKDFGKVQGLAKGIRVRCDRKDSKFFCFLEPLALNKIVYYQKSYSWLHLLTQTDLLNHFNPVRHSLNRITAASFALELVEKGTQLEDINKSIFDLLVATLNRLCDEIASVKETMLFFQSEFLRLSGFMPKDNKLNMPITDFIRIHIDNEFKTLDFMEKMKYG